MNIYCNKNQITALNVCSPYYKPHGARGLSKHYHLRFDPKLGMGKCEIRRIPCACVACTSMLDKPSISGIPSDKQEHYKPVTNCTYWPLIGYSNNWNMIQLSKKSSPYDAFDEMHQVVLDGINENMESLVESGEYGAIDTTDTVTNDFLYYHVHTRSIYTS